MRVYISVDMEGIGGVVHWDETNRSTDRSGYQYHRELMTAEANAAALGAFKAGASQVVINDSHGSMRNIIIDQLDERVELINGSSKQWGMMEGLTPDFDAAIFIGYHARATQLGVLSHTYSGSVLAYTINGQELGELGMNAAYAGHLGVPVAFVAGDSAAVSEGRALLGDTLPAVATKQARGRYAAQHKHPRLIRKQIKNGVEEALAKRDERQVFTVQAPVTVELKFKDAGQAHAALLLPGSERVDDLTNRYQASDYPTALQAARAMIHLAN